jgi:hypothetical protein
MTHYKEVITEYRKTFSVIYAETTNRKTFSVIYAETTNRKTVSVNVLCVHCMIQKGVRIYLPTVSVPYRTVP